MALSMLQLPREAEKDCSPGPCADNTSKSEKHKSKLKRYGKFTHAFHRKKYQIQHRSADDFTVPKTHLSPNPIPRTDNTNLCPFSYGFVQPTSIKKSMSCAQFLNRKL